MKYDYNDISERVVDGVRISNFSWWYWYGFILCGVNVVVEIRKGILSVVFVVIVCLCVLWSLFIWV